MAHCWNRAALYRRAQVLKLNNINFFLIIFLQDSSRILFATWWIFITILTAFYTANLTAFLTLSKFTLPINTIWDIGGKKYTWVSQKGNAIEAALDNVKSAKFILSIKKKCPPFRTLILEPAYKDLTANFSKKTGRVFWRIGWGGTITCI